MIAGDNYQRNFTYPVPDIQKSLWTGEFTTQAFLRQAAVGFNCLNYAIAPEGSLYRHFLPDKAYLDANCKDGVRFELMFPSCWNGKNDTLTHKNHVAYPSEVMTGNCPPDYPLRLVSLFYETIWRTEDFIGKDGQFIIANGDPTGMFSSDIPNCIDHEMLNNVGYGYHGDFIMGWNQTFLQQAVRVPFWNHETKPFVPPQTNSSQVDQCRNPSGRIEDCPVFDIQSSDVYSTCSIKEPPALASETATAGLDTLPGNPAIAYGPAYAQGSTAGSPSTKSRPSSSLSFAPFGTSATVPTLSHSAGSSLASSATYVPGAVFDEVRSSSSASAAPAAVITPAPPAPAVVEQAVSQSYFSTDYHTSGLTVNEVLWVEDVVTVSVPSAPTNSAAAVTGRKKRHLHKHRGVGV